MATFIFAFNQWWKNKITYAGDGEVENVTISADRSKIYYTTNISDIDRRHIWELIVQDATTKQITKGNEIEWSPVIVDGGLAILHSSAIKPAWPAIVQNNTVNEIAKELFQLIFLLHW
jgi:hypothetical protein